MNIIHLKPFYLPKHDMWHLSYISQFLNHCVLSFFFHIFIGVQKLYNVVLVSTVQQSESALCIHISPYPLPPEPPCHPSYPIPLGHHKAPSWSPCAMQQLPTRHPFYIWYCKYVNATLLLHPNFPFNPVPSSPFSASASLFLPCR